VLLNDKTAAVIMDVITATIDTVISCTMCYLLYQSRTEFTTYVLPPVARIVGLTRFHVAPTP
jgi:hypothetical protein